MDHFCRRKPFIIVQELEKLEDTKSLLSSKLNFIISQFKYLQDSISREGIVSPEFSKSFSICISLRIKIIQSLLYLTNSSSLCWAFLQTLAVEDQDPYIFGNLKSPSFLLDTGVILKDSGSYFFDLLSLGIIDYQTWRNLVELKNKDRGEGCFSINDTSYCEMKKCGVLSPLEDLERFKQFDGEFASFVRGSMKMNDPAPVIYPLLELTSKFDNQPLIKNFLVRCQFDYESIRRDKDFKKKLDIRQHQYLMTSLSSFDSFFSIYRAVAEFKLFKKRHLTKNVFLCVLNYFFSQQLDIFDQDYIYYRDLSPLEKITRSALWLDFILCMCENEICLDSVRRSSNDLAHQNFLEACEIELSSLLNPQHVQLMLLFDSDFLTLIMKKVHLLKENSFYRRNYSQVMDKYLSICCLP